ncbi:hypothetical protein ACIGW4_37265 [Streptomyces sp. NPDC053513]|uniref:hypothetical protein n=1 Tax=unclassified Streptomyces TaxID=2593676 RepID=UPI0037D5CF10
MGFALTGASRWSYFTPYRQSEQESLDALRGEVFAADAGGRPVELCFWGFTGD